MSLRDTTTDEIANFRESRAKRLCGKIVSARSVNDLTGYVLYFARCPVKGIQTTFHTASNTTVSLVL
jgi:hypothetical protein